MSKYFDGELLSAYEDLNKEFECKKENVKLHEKIADLEAKLAESEKKHLLDEKEWQDYCAYKLIEPQIKGCLDREREYEKQLAEKEKEIEEYKIMHWNMQKQHLDFIKELDQDKISFAVEQIIKLKNELADRAELIECGAVAEFMFTTYDLEMCSKQIIKQIKEMGYGKDV